VQGHAFIRSMKIFLSYASEDRTFVEPICLALRSQGHKVLFDRTGRGVR
jgi:TIR domain